LNDLLADAAGQLADAIAASAQTLPTEVAKAALVSFKISCSMTDPRQQPILIPAVSVSGDGKLITTNPPAAVQPMDVTVELDGVALGSAPGEFKARPGLHKIRLSREGFDDWTHTINVYDGQTLRVALAMSATGYANWKDTTDFLAHLDANKKLTDAEVKQIEGLGEFFKNSHYRVDTKENVHINKSLY
jgi:PEGA domain